MEVFVETPNLPVNKISLAIVDGRIPLDIEKKLDSMGIRLIKTTKNKNLYEAISYHPDIVMHHLGGKDILVAPNIDERVVYSLEDEGFRIIKGKSIIMGKYPYDIPFNAARIGKYAVCYKEYTDEVLIEELTRRNIKLINTRQGYSKCSLCVVSENSAITSDEGLYKMLNKNNIEGLLIAPGNIELFGMNYGFIGGTSGCISKKDIAFYGDMTLHPSYNEIKIFLSKYNKNIKNLSKNPPIDLGTLIPLKEYSILTI